jgi:hypothetical protein
MYVNQKTLELHQALMMPMSGLERRELVKDIIDTNLYLFLEYMEGY